ncbi:major capsid protein [Sigmofec virus UA08Rod_5935]|uniref:Major capsid protein n=1 Tax=Sigmofec virus UA08Rod_5935 TaxID=2929446 RepID=A0A976R7X9_9VIRU|nr:major capsid protein [Sigmofec virus UA08Rod_5935]
MSRNQESRFALNPTRLDISRSRFNRSHSVKTTFDVGNIIPFFVDEVLPGDTFSIDTSKVVRMQTLLTPMMDNIYLDTYYFFVPNRLTWEHWKQFNGENTESAWLPTVEYQVPQLKAPTGGWSIGTIADYMGIPTGVSNLSVNALPFRAYALIMNEWFRDENLTDPLNIPTGDATVQGVNTGSYITDVAKGGLPFKAAKYHDYFTSALPAPQKGPDVTIPVAAAGNYPVVPLAQEVPNNGIHPVFLGESSFGYRPIGMKPYSGQNDLTGNVGSSDSMTFEQALSVSDRYAGQGFANLWAVSDGNAAAATINQLRMAFQIQKLYERDARGGTRYIEILKSHFGVTSPDSRLQRPEYLGGNRIPININQVIQQSATESSGTPQGNVAAMSLTTDTHSDFTHSFTEHGFVIGLMVARYDHTYQQGIERFWSRKDRFDYYWPVFANIGEQAILNKEIYAQGTSVDDEVFGYQEAWADYRYKPSHVTGEMRSAAAQSLDVWHLADDYDSLPKLSDSWIRETPETVDRVLAVSSRVSDQLFADLYIKNTTTRAMPLYSIPGLIDHH